MCIIHKYSTIIDLSGLVFAPSLLTCKVDQMTLFTWYGSLHDAFCHDISTEHQPSFHISVCFCGISELDQVPLRMTKCRTLLYGCLFGPYLHVSMQHNEDFVVAFRYFPVSGHVLCVNEMPTMVSKLCKYCFHGSLVAVLLSQRHACHTICMPLISSAFACIIYGSLMP